jgi:hypothetical protein
MSKFLLEKGGVNIYVYALFAPGRVRVPSEPCGSNVKEDDEREDTALGFWSQFLGATFFLGAKAVIFPIAIVFPSSRRVNLPN